MANENEVAETVDQVKKTINPLCANIGIEFSLIGTKLHAAYEKTGEDGYTILLMPSKQMADNGVSIGEVISDIKGLIVGVDKEADTSGMEESLRSGVSSLSEEGGEGFDLNKLMIQLKMAYLYLHKTEKESTLEYAFQLQVISKDVIPKKIQKLINIDNLSISVWNTDRKKVTDQMALVTMNEYLGAASA